MSDWETAGSSRSTATSERVRGWRIGPLLAAFGIGIAIGAVLLGDVGEVACHEVTAEAVTLQQQVHGSEDVEGSVAALAALSRRHPGCFEPEWTARIRQLSEHGAPDIAILERPRTTEDAFPRDEPGSDLVTEESRLAARTEQGDFYVVPRSSSSGPDEVCLVLLQPDDGSAMSCASPATAALHASMPYEVVVTLSDGAGLAGIVGDGVNEVRIDGVPVQVRDNVFVSSEGSFDSTIEVP